MVTAKPLAIFSAAFIVAGLLLPPHKYAKGTDTLEAQKQALNMINDFADHFCINIPLAGSGNQLELSGDAKAELNELIKKIVNLKIEGAAKYLSGEYQGVLQKDLVEALKNSVDCKRDIWKDLKKLVPQPSQPEPEPSPPQPVPPNPSYSNKEIL